MDECEKDDAAHEAEATEIARKIVSAMEGVETCQRVLIESLCMIIGAEIAASHRNESAKLALRAVSALVSRLLLATQVSNAVIVVEQPKVVQ